MQAQLKTATTAGLEAAEGLLCRATGLRDHTQHVETHGLGQRPAGRDARTIRKLMECTTMIWRFMA